MHSSGKGQHVKLCYYALRAERGIISILTLCEWSILKLLHLRLILSQDLAENVKAQNYIFFRALWLQIECKLTILRDADWCKSSTMISGCVEKNQWDE